MNSSSFKSVCVAILVIFLELCAIVGVALCGWNILIM